MFYENFERICKDNGTSPSAALVSIGKSRSLASAWKRNGTVPKSEELVELSKLLNCRVADFFDSPVEQVLALHGDKPMSEVEAELRQTRSRQPVSVAIDGVLIDDNIRDFIFIYRNASNRQRNQLMRAVYDFEEKVLNGD